MSDLRKVIANSSYLILTQCANYLAPFIAVPFLAKELSVEQFGLIMALVALLQFSYLLTEYGFNVFVTKKIIDKSNELDFVARVNLSVIVIKSIITIVISTLIFFIYGTQIGVIPVFIFFFALLFQAMQPSWIISALEKFKVYSFSIFIGKVIYVFLLLFIGVSDSPVEVVLSCFALSNLITLLLTYFLIYKSNKRYLGLSFNSSLTLGLLKEGVGYLAARFTSNAHFFSSASLVGFLFGNQAAGIYASADTLSRAVKGVLGSILQAVFPRIASSKSKKSFIYIGLLSCPPIICGLGLLYYLADFFINFLFGDKLSLASEYLQYLIPVIFLNYINGYLGYPLFALYNKSELVNKISYISFSFFALYLLVLVSFYEYGVNSLILSFLWFEVFSLILRLGYLFWLIKISKHSKI